MFLALWKGYNSYHLIDFSTRLTVDSESAFDNCLTNIPKNRLSITGLVTELYDQYEKLLEINNVKYISLKNVTNISSKFSNESIDSLQIIDF